MLQMHLMPKCILAYIFLWTMFSVHFPKENVQLCKNAFLHHIFQRKMFSNAVQKCIWCQNAFDAKMHFGNATHHILRSKLFSITFYEVKCSASHFPLENVQQTRIPCTLYFSEVSVFNKRIELLLEAYHNLTITFFAKKNKIYNFFKKGFRVDWRDLDAFSFTKWKRKKNLV